MLGSPSPRVFAEVFVLGGFPALASATVLRDEFGSCAGGPGFDLDDVELLTRNGRPCPFLTRKMSKADWESVDDQIRAHMNRMNSQRLEDC